MADNGGEFFRQLELAAAAMDEYRLAFLDADGGQTQSVRYFRATDDVSAIERADQWRGTGAAELWSGERAVESWKLG